MKTPKNDGGPAFPHSSQPLDRQGNPIMENHSEWGMSLRDWFAGMALQGALACPASKGEFADFASDSYCYADAMLAARKEQP